MSTAVVVWLPWVLLTWTLGRRWAVLPWSNLPTWCMGDQNKDGHITFTDFQILHQHIITCIMNKFSMSLYLYCMCRLAACLPCVDMHEFVESNFTLQNSHFPANFDNNTCTFHATDAVHYIPWDTVTVKCVKVSMAFHFFVWNDLWTFSTSSLFI